MRIKPIHAFAAAAILAPIILYLLYLPGTGGVLFYDDYNALGALGNIETLADAKGFVTTGTAGPLGRPIALASYLIHAPGWPNNTAAIIHVNILVHLANGFLLALIAGMILRLRGISVARAAWAALGAAVLWASMPIIASATLIPIQRMTTLSALFGLLGILGFVSGYWLRTRTPQLAFLVQFGSLGLGTLFGVYTKETAALIPVFALLIDGLLLGHRRYPNHYQWLSRAILIVALLAIVIYLSPLMRDWFSVSAHRGWSAWDRLQFQVVLLWEYLHLTLAPLPTTFSPFHDHRSIGEFPAGTTLLAALGWVLALSIAMWTHARHSNPWMLFATLWFLTGHLLESTVIHLELVFEHRNYLAVFGLALALSVAAAHAPARWRVAAPVFFVAFLGLQATILAATTSTWGQPRVAAEIWSERNPASSRAAMHAVALIVKSNGEGGTDTALDAVFTLLEDRPHAIRILDRTADACPKCLAVRMQALLLSCGIATENNIHKRFAAIRELGGGPSRVNISVVDGVFALEERITAGQCEPLNTEDLLGLIEAIESRPTPINKHLRGRLLFVAAKVHYDRDETGKALESLSIAESIAAEALPILQFQVYIQQTLEDDPEALRAVERRRLIDRSGTAMTDLFLDEMEREIRKNLRRSY